MVVELIFTGAVLAIALSGLLAVVRVAAGDLDDALRFGGEVRDGVSEVDDEINARRRLARVANRDRGLGVVAAVAGVALMRDKADVAEGPEQVVHDLRHVFGGRVQVRPVTRRPGPGRDPAGKAFNAPGLTPGLRQDVKIDPRHPGPRSALEPVQDILRQEADRPPRRALVAA